MNANWNVNAKRLFPTGARTRKTRWGVFLVLGCVALTGTGIAESCPSAKTLPRTPVEKTTSTQTAVAWRPKERWRGFNLTGMFIRPHVGAKSTFAEEDFAIVRDLGFNFVRLPMDYRYWIAHEDWEQIDETAVKQVDDAIAWARKYKLHTMLNFHRAPGYTVALPAEPRNLFTDPKAQEVCAKHWAFFARRYRDIPNDDLSFNLMNEPPEGCTNYAAIVRMLSAAIHAEDPKRFIVADGEAYGRRPNAALLAQDAALVGQASRGYTPMSVSHYLAPWVGTPSAKPMWPAPAEGFGILYAPQRSRPGWEKPLRLLDVPAGELSIAVVYCSGANTIQIDVDGQPAQTILLDPYKGGPLWQGNIHPQHKIWQGRYLGTVKMPLAKPAREVSIRNARGDWFRLDRVSVTRTDGRVAARDLQYTWGEANEKPYRFQGWNDGLAFVADGERMMNADYLRDVVYGDWIRAKDAGAFVMVGEFGAAMWTPHDVTLRWIEDMLKVWKEHDIPWAIWGLYGHCGILDVNRAGVSHENYRGHKLDRKLLDLLQKY